MNDDMPDKSETAEPRTEKKLSAAAKRALAEAEARRAGKTADPDRPRELLGREGPEPTRYGDWENKGIISDF